MRRRVGSYWADQRRTREDESGKLITKRKRASTVGRSAEHENTKTKVDEPNIFMNMGIGLSEIHQINH